MGLESPDKGYEGVVAQILEQHLEWQNVFANKGSALWWTWSNLARKVCVEQTATALYHIRILLRSGIFRHVWPVFKASSVQHDSYLCQRYQGSIPFPTKRPDEGSNYVGSKYLSMAKLDKECPKACRPKMHQDWLNC